MGIIAKPILKYKNTYCCSRASNSGKRLVGLNVNKSIFTILLIALVFVSVLAASVDAAGYSRSSSSSTTYSRSGTTYSSTGYVQSRSSSSTTSSYVAPITNYNTPTRIVSTPTPTATPSVSSTSSNYRTSAYSTQALTSISPKTASVSSLASRSSNRAIGVIPSTTPSAIAGCAVNSDCVIKSVITVPNATVLKFNSLTITPSGVLKVENSGTIYLSIANVLTVNGKITANGAKGIDLTWIEHSNNHKAIKNLFVGAVLIGLTRWVSSGDSASFGQGAVVGGIMGYTVTDSTTLEGIRSQPGAPAGKIVVQAKDVIVTGRIEAIGGNGGLGHSTFDKGGKGGNGGQVIIQTDEIISLSEYSTHINVVGGNGPAGNGLYGSKDVSDGYALSKIILTPATAQVKSGSTQSFSATMYDKRNRPVLDAILTYSSSDSSVATFNANVLTALKPGDVTVAASSNGISSTAQIKVIP